MTSTAALPTEWARVIIDGGVTGGLVRLDTIGRDFPIVVGIYGDSSGPLKTVDRQKLRCVDCREQIDSILHAESCGELDAVDLRQPLSSAIRTRAAGAKWSESVR